jgi:type IV pilus assembly protein PilA
MLKKIGKRLKDQRGLTLVELLAVIVILGIIAAIAVPSIGSVIDKSRYDAAKADAIQALNAAKLYVAAEGTPSEALTKDDLLEYLEKTDRFWSDFKITVSDNTYTFEGTKSADAKFNNDPEITGTVAQIEKLQYKKAETVDPKPGEGKTE